jgi:hypothetical protein
MFLGIPGRVPIQDTAVMDKRIGFFYTEFSAYDSKLTCGGVNIEAMHTKA